MRLIVNLLFPLHEVIDRFIYRLRFGDVTLVEEQYTLLLNTVVHTAVIDALGGDESIIDEITRLAPQTPATNPGDLVNAAFESLGYSRVFSSLFPELLTEGKVRLELGDRVEPHLRGMLSSVAAWWSENPGSKTANIGAATALALRAGLNNEAAGRVVEWARDQVPNEDVVSLAVAATSGRVPDSDAARSALEGWGAPMTVT
ncbi:MAG: hypothetical protein Q8Q29_07845 [Actinomycetota bacterium]|nr:hypothetical protein [Actinomycetota bacterium]